jgi:hypothetical protein
MSWSTQPIFYTKDYMSYTVFNENKDFYNSLDIINIKSKKEAMHIINGIVGDHNIIHIAKRYFGLTNSKIDSLNQTARLTGQPVISKSNRIQHAGAMALENNKYINGMLQVLDTLHDFGKEAANEMLAAGFLLPDIFILPDYKYYCNKDNREKLIPKSGQEDFILELLANHETLTFIDPNINELVIVNNPIFGMGLAEYNIDRGKLNKMTFSELYQNYKNYIGGVKKSNKRYIPHELWAYENKDSVSKNEITSTYNIVAEMIADICSEFRDSYVPILGNNLYFQIDNWTIMGQVLLAFKYYNEALEEKIYNSQVVREKLEEAYRFPNPFTIEIFINDANGFDGSVIKDKFNINPLATGNVYPDGLPYQVKLEGTSTITNKKEITKIVKHILEEDGAQRTSFRGKPKVKPENKMLVQFSIYEKTDNSLVPVENEKYIVPFKYGIIPVDCSELFSINTIKKNFQNRHYIQLFNGISQQGYQYLIDTRYNNLPSEPIALHIELVKSLKPITQFALKRARDWGQVESCIDKQTNKITKVFVTEDKMAAAYAISRGVPILFNHKKDIYHIKTTSFIIEDMPRTLINRLLVPFSFVFSRH